MKIRLVLVIALLTACAGGTEAAYAVPVPVAPHAAIRATHITIDGNGGARVYDGVGAILGGGGNARYLVDYPPAQRAQIMDYLFKPGYGASLQILKLEIGGDGNSSDGAEPSVEHSAGHINCNAGYEFAIAEQAVALNPRLRLYGLQWGAPGWVGQHSSLFTSADIQYLIDWLGCAKKHHLTVSYLGGWNERDHHGHADWYRRLRAALDRNGYRPVRIVAGDSGGDSRWEYLSSRSIAIAGAHRNCGAHTGAAGPRTKCTSTAGARKSGKPLWGSEMGGMDAAAHAGCTYPCAPTMDRIFTREYIDARVTGVLEWPAIDAMPASVLPYENRGLVTADQPWSGSYHVNAMTWAIAHITQFAWPPTPTNPGGWRFVNSASGYLAGNRIHGSYVTLLRSTRDSWSTIIETTSGVTSSQQVSFTVKGGHGLAGKTVHVWTSNFSPKTTSPSQWFVRQRDITPVKGRFTITVKPGRVYSLTTTTGQGKGKATGPASRGLPLPYTNSLATGPGEPTMLATQDGSFELARCPNPDGSGVCTKQTTGRQPVLWVPGKRHPYAIIGGDWRNYAVRVRVMLPRSGSAGLIGRYHAVSASHGTYNAYVFSVNTDGSFALKLHKGGKAADTTSGQRQLTPPHQAVLARGRVPFAPGTWHTLSLSVSGTTVKGGVDGRQVASFHNSVISRGIPGIQVGGWYPAYFANLSVTSP
jgi:glycosyl hydrolase family 59/glycosyl hydrolase family 59 (putative galactocerebrosidase)